MITQVELMRLFEYDPDSGVFIRKTTVKRHKQGTIAGCKKYRNDIPIDISITIHGKDYKAHRLAYLYMTGNWPENEIDHIDQNAFNNAWSNLRDVTRSENHRNQRLSKNNTSGVCGVSFDYNIKKWSAYIKVDNINIFLGHAAFKKDAIKIRKDAEEKYNFHKNHGRKT
jgi:hypothetical protein